MSELLEKILDKRNMNKAYKKVRELGYPTFTEFYLKICKN